jgi:hypothetical protein
MVRHLDTSLILVAVHVVHWTDLVGAAGSLQGLAAAIMGAEVLW